MHGRHILGEGNIIGANDMPDTIENGCDYCGKKVRWKVMDMTQKIRIYNYLCDDCMAHGKYVEVP